MNQGKVAVAAGGIIPGGSSSRWDQLERSA